MSFNALSFGPISPAAPGPLYEQIVAAVKREVAAGRLRPGDALPSLRALAAELMVSLITVKRAYAELGQAGVIVTRHGMGSFVAESRDLSTTLLRAEFTKHLDAMLASARRLGLSAEDIRRLLDEQADWSADSTEGSTP